MICRWYKWMGSAPNSNTSKTGKNTWLEKVVPDTLPSVNRLSLLTEQKTRKQAHHDATGV
jgi:hypothetical protein